MADIKQTITNATKKGFFDDPDRLSGGATGLIGAGAGYMLLKGLGNKGLERKDKKLKEEAKRLKDSVNKVNEVYGNSFNPVSFQKELRKNPNLNGLTVGEVEDLAERYYNNNISPEKTASVNKFRFAQGALASAIPVGAAGLADFIGDRNSLKKDIDSSKESISDSQKFLESRNKEKIPFEDYMKNHYTLTSSSGAPTGVYTPSALMGADEHPTYGDPLFGEDINDALKRKGIDYKKLNWNDYEKLVSDYATDTNKYDLTDSESYSNKMVDSFLKNKKALEIVENEFNKIAMEVNSYGW